MGKPMNTTFLLGLLFDQSIQDQIDKVFQYSNQGLEQVEQFYRTVSDIYKIYLSLVKKHKALVIPQTSNKNKLVLENSTYVGGFNKFIGCLNDQATIYETQAEEIRDQVLNPLKSFIDQMKTSIATQSNEYTKFKNNLENNKRILDRAWAKYYQAYVNKKRAEANYQKIKDDKTVPRVDIERVQGVAIQKMGDFEKIRGEYAIQLHTFNSARSVLFLQDLPKLCSELEIFDRRRAEVTADTGTALVSIQKRHLERTATCNGVMGDSMSFIDFRSDSAALVQALRSHSMFPPDMVFVDLEKSKSDAFNAKDFPGILQQGGKIEKGDSAKSLFGHIGLRGIETKEMLPEQVRLDEVMTATKVVEKKLAGLKVLEDSYVNNPSMGDKSLLQPQIDINERQLASLKDMTETVSKNAQNLPPATVTITSAPVRGSAGMLSGDSKKLSMTTTGGGGNESDSSFDDEEEEDFDGTSPNNLSMNSNTSRPGQSTSSNNLARVLYDFEPTDAQQLAVVTDMNVRVLTYDDSGSGWTLVQNITDNSLKGYVPTNYIQMV